MASFYQDKGRIVFPRWRDFRNTSQSGDVKPFVVKPITVFTKNDILNKIEAWEFEQSISSASELVNSAFNLGLTEHSKAAAEFILKNKKNIPSGLTKVLNQTLGRPEIESTPFQNLTFDRDMVNKYFYKQIAEHRRRLTNYPYNPIMWVELGRLHAIVNNIEKAERVLLIALHLAPENRYVLRSLARFYIHSHQADKALFYLNRNPITKHDPWLLSTQISVHRLVKKQNSHLIKNGFQLLETSKFSAFDKNELASSLGTMELIDGGSKQARKLFNQSLINPNDNSVAQASWASKHVSGLIIQQNSLDLPCAYEARALEFFAQGKYKEALAESIKWLLDEPFASRPARMSSHIASTYVADLSLASELARFAIQNSPNNFDLINNLAYSLSLENKPEEAEMVYEKLIPSQLTDRETVAFTATNGLIQYRKNNPEEGKKLYQEALAKAKEIGDDYLYRLALVNYCREEVTANPQLTNEVEPLLNNLKKDSTEKQIQVELERIEAFLSGKNIKDGFNFV